MRVGNLLLVAAGLLGAEAAHAARVRFIQRADGFFGPGSASFRVTQEDRPLNFYGEPRAFGCVLDGIIFDPFDVAATYDGATTPPDMAAPNQIDLVLDANVLTGTYAGMTCSRDTANPVVYALPGAFTARLGSLAAPLAFAFVYDGGESVWLLNTINGVDPTTVMVDFETVLGGMTTTFVQQLPFGGFTPLPHVTFSLSAPGALVFNWQTAMPLDLTGGLNAVTQPWLSALDTLAGTGPGTRFLQASERETGGWQTIKGVPASGSLPFMFEGTSTNPSEVLVWQVGSGDFDDPMNWSPQRVPGHGDSAIWENLAFICWRQADCAGICPSVCA